MSSERTSRHAVRPGRPGARVHRPSAAGAHRRAGRAPDPRSPRSGAGHPSPRSRSAPPRAKRARRAPASSPARTSRSPPCRSPKPIRKKPRSRSRTAPARTRSRVRPRETMSGRRPAASRGAPGEPDDAIELLTAATGGPGPRDRGTACVRRHRSRPPGGVPLVRTDPHVLPGGRDGQRPDPLPRSFVPDRVVRSGDVGEATSLSPARDPGRGHRTRLSALIARRATR